MFFSAMVNMIARTIENNDATPATPNPNESKPEVVEACPNAKLANPPITMNNATSITVLKMLMITDIAMFFCMMTPVSLCGLG